MKPSKKIFPLLFFIWCIPFFSNAQQDTVLYSFFSAGHTYGSPMDSNIYGIHPPFKAYFPQVNAIPKLEFGVFTGDMVRFPIYECFDSALTDIAALNMPIYVTAGNHDFGTVFLNMVGPYYDAFMLHGDLFIYLTPSMDQWNITGNQMAFLQQTLDSLAPAAQRLFVFQHQLTWWSPDSIFSDVIINYAPQYPGWTNFWSEVEPMFADLDKEVTIFAGDLGASPMVTPLMYHHYDKMTLIGSGMGSYIWDHFIVTDVYADTVIHRIVALNGSDPNAMGDISDYNILDAVPEAHAGGVEWWPNPAIEKIFFRNVPGGNAEFHFYTLQGKEVYTTKATKEVDVSGLRPGMYIMEIRAGKESSFRRMIKR